MKYTDPDGNEVVSATALGLVFLGTAAALTIQAYLQTPEGQRGAAALNNAISTGTQNACMAITNAVSGINSRVSEKTKNNDIPTYVHKSNNIDFANALVINGTSAINRDILNRGDNRFGGQFYVASDKATADLERPGSGTYIKLTFTSNARILDLTNPETATKYNYSKGMSHEACRNLMDNWDLENYDAIKYPSERGGNYNFAVMNFDILIPLGVE